MRTAIFAGTFDPFTIAHKDIVVRALPLFDRIVIGIGINQDKQPLFPLEDRLARICNAFADEKKVSVETYDTLTIDFARKHSAQFLLRGIRTISDFEYERTMADANRQLTADEDNSSLETVLFLSLPQYAHISSSLVRDLYKHGYDISPFIV